MITLDLNKPDDARTARVLLRALAHVARKYRRRTLLTAALLALNITPFVFLGGWLNFLAMLALTAALVLEAQFAALVMGVSVEVEDVMQMAGVAA